MPGARKGLLAISKFLRDVDRSITAGRAVDHWDCGFGPPRLWGQCAPVWLGDNRRGPSSVINRTPTSNVKYDQTQPRITESRLRTPSKNITCTAPHSHHAAAPVSLSRPKSATALLRPIVAKLPWCR